MAKVYFISEAYLKQNTPINLNVEPQLVNLAILEAQQIYIQTALGTDLYKKIESLIVSASISGVYKTLLDDYISPALTQYSLYEVIPYIRFKIMNKSIGGQSSDNSTPAELEEIKFLQANIKNKAEYLGQRLMDYLIANSKLYPEYLSNTDIDDIKPNSNSYFCGLQLDDDYNCDRFIGYNKNNKNLL